MKRGSLYLLTVCLLAMVCAQAQPPACDSRRRVLPVNVLDREGNQVWGLTAADFRAEFRGQPVQIVSVGKDSGPRRVVILLDASGSMMTLRGKWPLARKAAEDITVAGPAELSLALVLFAETFSNTVPFAQGRLKLQEELGHLEERVAASVVEGPRTALRDTILGLATLFDAPLFGDAVFLVTDGGENTSRANNRAVAQFLLERGMRVFGFLFRSPPSPVAEADPFFQADDLVDLTGGGAVGFPGRLRPGVPPPFTWYHLSEQDEADLAFALRNLYGRMVEFYRVEVELPREVDKARGWKLEVVDAQGKRRKDLTVLCPRKLVPCTDTAE